MRKTVKVLMTSIIALTLVLVLASLGEAKPVDYGEVRFQPDGGYTSFTDSSGRMWDFYFYRKFSNGYCYTHIYSYKEGEPSIEPIDYYDDINYSVNFRKGTASFSNLEFSITIKFNSSDVESVGDRKSGSTFVYEKPATISGTILGYPVQADLTRVYLKLEHDIVNER